MIAETADSVVARCRGSLRLSRASWVHLGARRRPTMSRNWP